MSGRKRVVGGIVVVFVDHVELLSETLAEVLLLLRNWGLGRGLQKCLAGERGEGKRKIEIEGPGKQSPVLVRGREGQEEEGAGRRVEEGLEEEGRRPSRSR